MTLLVLDTNALGHGQFTVNGLRRWMDAVGDGQTVIPEIVIWEWAEHAAEAQAVLSSHIDGFRVDPQIYARPQLAERASADVIVDQIESLLPRSVEIWRTPSDVWKQAVRDQVLQVGTGERKAGIKTGASDSIVLACVQEQIDNRAVAEAVVLATSDKGLTRTCARRFGDELLLTRSTSDLLEKLNAFEPAENELWEQTEESVKDFVEDSRSDVGLALETFEMGFRIHVGARAASRSREEIPTRDFARLGRVEIVELHDLRVVASEDKSRRVGLADIRIFADMHMTQLHLLETYGGASEWVTMYEGPVAHGFVDLTVTVVWNRHWKVTSVAPAGEAVLVFDTSEYDDLEDVPPFHASADQA